ncbi:hypothetical protein VPNG_00544 [Cytospora leucostoma]|uniref:Uncharacterized protein n=1 Tax=Cytospora leucostoma TaxID=1230097 RepID=A0A423XM91_9PEZI|nr:hypothetical protein VPNG_00544 [Cytospora leucostoma]
MESITAPPTARSSPPARPPSPRTTQTTSFVLPSAPGSASGPPPAPSGHAFRRAATVDDTSQSRRKPSLSSFYSSDHAESPTTQRLQRRSSTLSDFSMSEARRSLRDSTDDILNPSGAKHGVAAHDSPGALAALPVAFALLPALFGVMFEGGNALATDVMLLGLVFIFLRYTITQPWQWYLSAQVARTRQEDALDLVFEDESEIDGPAKRSASIESAINELYVHEVLALISCFVSPVVGAYLLHAIRGQLSRPSEGLLTDFNITVFLLAAELKPLSHALKLIQSRTLHLNKIVQSAPISRSTTNQLEEMRCRLAQLEYRAEAAEEVTAQALTRETQKQQQNGGSGNKHDAALVREVRNAIQPELDALNRAVRRYEKKATVLALQTESRLGVVDTRLNDAIALAAAAAKQNNQAHWSFFALVRWVVDSIVWVALIPYDAAMFIVVWPFRTVAGLWSRKGSRKESRTGTGGSARSSRSHAGKGTRSGSGSERDRFRDRMPSRLSRRYSP